MNQSVGVPIAGGARTLLLVGFGGLLILLAFLGASSVVALNYVEKAETSDTQRFITRANSLNAVRNQITQATKRVRDYLLDGNPALASKHADEAVRIWSIVDEDLRRYRSIAPPDAGGQLDRLRALVSQYRETARLTLASGASSNASPGYVLLASRLDPIREDMFGALDDLQRLDQERLRAGMENSSRTIHALKLRLLIDVLSSLMLGLVLAGATLLRLVRLETAARERYAALIQAHGELARLSQRVLDVQEQERRSLARELHDEVSQSLGALLVDLGNARNARTAGDAERHLAAAKNLGDQALASIRSICLLLRPSMLDDLGLVPALHWQARETARRSGVQVKVITDDADMQLPDAHRTAVYRVVQEALNNAVRHAEAQHVRILLRRDESRVLVVIQDDGKGFDPKLARGLGLLGMQERVTHLQGKLQIESAAGKGAVLQIELPLDSTVSSTLVAHA